MLCKRPPSPLSTTTSYRAFGLAKSPLFGAACTKLEAMSAERGKIVDDSSVGGPAVGWNFTPVKRKNPAPLPVFATSNYPFFFYTKM